MLTLGEMVCGDLPELLEGGVALERRRDVLRALITDAIPPDTANGSQTQTSGGADTFVQKRARNVKEATHMSVLNFGANPDESKYAMTLASLAVSPLDLQSS